MRLLSLLFFALFLAGCGLYEAKYVKPSNMYKSNSWNTTKLTVAPQKQEKQEKKEADSTNMWK